MTGNIANYLTLFRIASIPVVVGLFFWENSMGPWIAVFVFALACFSDFLDGYLARTLHQITNFGRFLDPVADKLLIASTLLMLVGFGHIQGIAMIPAIVILCREILVSGLREFLGQVQISVPVGNLAKCKTALQMLSLGFLIVGSPTNEWVLFWEVGTWGLWVSGFLTLVTGWRYMREGIEYITKNPV